MGISRIFPSLFSFAESVDNLWAFQTIDRLFESEIRVQKFTIASFPMSKMPRKQAILRETNPNSLFRATVKENPVLGGQKNCLQKGKNRRKNQCFCLLSGMANSIKSGSNPQRQSPPKQCIKPRKKAASTGRIESPQLAHFGDPKPSPNRKQVSIQFRRQVEGGSDNNARNTQPYPPFLHSWQTQKLDSGTIPPTIGSISRGKLRRQSAMFRSGFFFSSDSYGSRPEISIDDASSAQ